MITETKLKSDGLDITGQLHLPSGGQPPYPAVILCHGVPSGRVADPSDGGYPFLAETIAVEGFAVFIFNFRGCGTSQGDFNVAGWSRDLKTVIDYVAGLDEINPARIALTGFSAGATVSLYVAAGDRRVSAVAGCASPADFSLIYASADPRQHLERYRNIGIIRDPLYPPDFEGWLDDFRKINALACVADLAPRPLLLLHARDDSVVPVENSRKLYRQAGEPKKLVIIEGDEHRLRRSPQAVNILTGWLKESSK
ncbi:MAG: alpha/beta fold hydrolase [Dehalococcoidales bacterium]|nr:alpha/beta fold hydrolase [Dehalococcoidales bacterium]